MRVCGTYPPPPYPPGWRRLASFTRGVGVLPAKAKAPAMCPWGVWVWVRVVRLLLELHELDVNDVEALIRLCKELAKQVVHGNAHPTGYWYSTRALKPGSPSRSGENARQTVKIG